MAAKLVLEPIRMHGFNGGVWKLVDKTRKVDLPMRDGFSIEAVGRALAGTGTVTSVEVVERFTGCVNEVARLAVRFSDSTCAGLMIGKLATGTGLAAGRRERAFFERVAPAWDSGAPALLGACELGTTDDVAPRLLLVTEDLGAIGYRVRGTAVSPAELAGAIDALASLYARFWDAVPVEYLDGDFDAESVTRCARAWPPELAVRHGGAARAAAAEFLAGEGVACSPNERALLEDILTAWPGQRAARVAAGRALTLIHADFHFLGNVLFRDHDPRPRIIDWSELKPGLGPHDVAYCLTPIATDDRPARDRALLRRYWDGLRAHGVDDYPWELCRWDHQFSLITNLLQALFQASLMWFRHGVAMIEAHDCRTVLTVPPPRGS